MAETRTRVVEVAVAILLAACGVSATVGIFEAQEHRGTAVWFTGSAAAMIAAVLVPVIVFGFFPWIERLSRKHRSELATSGVAESFPPVQLPSHGSVTTTQVATQLSPGDRIIVDVTPKYLTDFYVDRMDFEGAASVERYRNKWMPVVGHLKDVVDHPAGTHTPRWMGVYLERDSLDEKEPAVSFFFADPRWFDRLLVLKRGDPISILGRIDKVQRGSVVLDDCELVGHAG